MLASISEHKEETESAMSHLKQEMYQSQEQVDNRLHAISGEVRSSIQELESRANDSEIMRINEAISSLEAKIKAEVTCNNSTAIQPNVVSGVTAVVQTDSSGRVWSNTSVNRVE